MYRASRQLHRWVGFFASLFLLLVATTGFLLANKARWGWMRPPVVQAESITLPSEIVTVERVVESVFELGLVEMRSLADIDRVHYRPKDNVFKVVSKEGYREVQVDGRTGRVLSNSFRPDQFAEDIHDLSFFGKFAHAWLLPLVALALATLAASGIGLFLTPAVRRWKFRRSKARE